MDVEELLERLDAAEDGLENEPPMAGLRLRAVRDIAREVTRVALDLADRTNEYERALLAKIKSPADGPPNGVPMRARVAALRQQVQWARASVLADLVSLLLEEAMGGGPVSSDTAGIACTDEERERIAWLAREGWRVRRGGGARGSGRRLVGLSPRA